MNKNKLQNLLKKLETLEGSLPVSETKQYLDDLLETETQKFQKSFKENPTVKFLDGFNVKLDKFKKDFNLTPIINEIEDIQEKIQEFKGEYENQVNEIYEVSERKFEEFSNLINSTKDELSNKTATEIKSVLDKLGVLENDFTFQTSASDKTGKTLKEAVTQISERIDGIFNDLKNRDIEDGEFNKTLQSSLEEHSMDLQTIKAEIEKVRQEFLKRISGLGGGSMNRNIAIAGNTSVLSRYTDINIKPGSNVTLSYVNNNTTKYLDLTISATGSGGSVAGVAREINKISVSSTVGAVSGIDYVTICDQGVKITLPTAVGNTNLYTIKNVSTSSVMVMPDGVETIDTEANIILPVRFTAIDLVSDGGNWNIT